jgi:hypothetical protein
MFVRGVRLNHPTSNTGLKPTHSTAYAQLVLINGVVAMWNNLASLPLNSSTAYAQLVLVSGVVSIVVVQDVHLHRSHMRTNPFFN